MTKRSKKLRKLRGLRCESLESRSLLAGDLGCSPWQNPDGADDVNADGEVSPIDALVTINAMNDGGAGSLQGRFAPPALHGRFHNAIEHYVDPSGDSQLTPLDALLIINALNSQPATTTTTTTPVTTASLTDETTEETTAADDGSTAEDTEDTEETSTDDTSTDDSSGEETAADDSASTDEQPDEIGPDVPELTLQNGFARVRSAIDAAGDADVFRVVPTDTQLAVTLFAPRGAALQVSLVDASGETIETVTTTGTGRHEHVTLDGAVVAGETYYLVVTGAADTTGNYCLGIMNYDPANFTPPTEGEPPHGADDETRPAPPTATEFFQKVDANSDGSITLEELQAIPSPAHVSIDWPAIFAELDADGDGLVSATEFAAGVPTLAPPGRGGPRGEGDHHGGHHGGPHGHPGHGRPTPELPTAEALFAQIDGDADGLITLDELEAQSRSPRMLTMLDQIFAEWDVDASGALDAAEVTAGLAAKA